MKKQLAIFKIDFDGTENVVVEDPADVMSVIGTVLSFVAQMDVDDRIIIDMQEID